MKTAVAEIRRQTDLDRLFAGVVESFRAVEWDDWLETELRELEIEHAKYFVARVGPDGKSWAPLAPSTIRRKGHATPLVDTGRLRDSLTKPQSEFGFRYAVDSWPSRATAIFGTDAPYSVYHDTGTDRMPARRHVGVYEKYANQLAVRAVEHVLEGLTQ